MSGLLWIMIVKNLKQMNLKQQSIQLVAVNQRNEFYLTSDAKKLLNSIQKPIAVITIAGVYRSGKSYLVNRLLKNKQNGFATGSSVEPVTKGLNIWGRPIPAQDENGNEFVYIVIDSQGIGSYDQEIKYDIKLLMLVFLISSTVIYNSLGAIDQVTLDQLRTVVNLKQSLANQESKEKVKLVWVLRDFALQLVNKNGREMTSDDYLQQCLEEVHSSNSDTRKKNQIRRAIKDTFERRHCYTLVRPTIKEEDLRNLDQCRLRTQFLEGIQSIREQVFSGSFEDIKKINRSSLNGNLLVKLLQECIRTLNQNGIPSIKMMWQSIKQCSDQQAFDTMCNDMKYEIHKIALPMPKEELKTKLNDIQNKIYQRIEKQYGGEVQTFKKYHRQFIHLAQKVNRDVKKSNAQMQKQKSLKELRQFTKSNISLQSIEPTNLSLVKNNIDRMQLKSKGQIQGYEYILSVLFDIMHISEQKAVQLQREASEKQKMIEASSFQRRNSDINLASLKHDYHQSLKTINTLKHIQQSNQKQTALYKQKYEILQINYKNLQQENQIKVQNLIRQLQDSNFRARQRVQDASIQTKKLRQEKIELQKEIESLKEQRLRQGLNERKQIIFEQKMKETWDRFEEQRIFFRKQLDKLRKQSQINFQKYEQQRRYRQKESQQFSKDRQMLVSKERQYIQQLQQIKNLHAQTKKTYNATFDALKDNDRIFKNIQNVTQSHSKISGVKKNSQNIEAVRRHYQEQLQRTRNDLDEQIRSMNVELAKANHLNHQQKIRLSEQQSRCRNYMSQKQRLQRELQASHQRFSDTVGQIEAAKERERSLYQDSIVRLLSNLQKRQYSSISSTSFYKK